MIHYSFYSFSLFLLIQVAEIDINGSSIFYLYHNGGTSTTVVFEAGARGNTEIWQHILPALEEEGISYLAYDRAGHGQSEESGNERTINQISDDLSVLIKKLGIEGELLLVGHSMGGVYQQHFASVHDGKLKALVLIDVPHYSWENRLLACMDEAQIENRNNNIEYFRRTTTKGFKEESINARSSFDILNKAILPQVPAVIIYGGAQSWPVSMDGDCLTESWIESQQLHLAEFENSVLEISRGSGHLVPAEDPELVIAAIMSQIDN